MWSQRGGWWVLAQVMLLAVLVVLLVTGVGAFDLPNGPSSLARIIGAIVVAMALVEGVLGVRDLGVNLTPFPHPLDQARLVESGIYAKTRHPLYGAVILGSVGVSLLSVNGAALGWAFLIAGFFYAKSRHEETRLVAHYPSYVGYRLRVTKRFVPWVF